MNPEWRFRPLEKDILMPDPVQDEFFTTAIVGGLAPALVREVVQNSLDAGRTCRQGPVRLRFNFAKIDSPLGRDQAQELLRNLPVHLRADGAGLRCLPRLDGAMPVVSIEDFGTPGLEGDVLEHDPKEDDGGPHDFFWFWRNVGRSGKSREHLGRWGLGKSVFPALSSINAFYGVSKRRSDGGVSLMGQCVLKSHRDRHGATRCSPYGYFACYTDGESQFFATPMEDKEYINRLCDALGLHRMKEPGFSIVLPFPREEVNAQSVEKEVLRQWFIPILRGDLAVTIAGSGPDRVLDAECLDSAELELPNAEYEPAGQNAGLLSLAKWALSVSDADRVILSARSGGAPSWDNISVPESVVGKLRQDFDAGRRLAFRVHLRVQRTGENPTDSFFDVYMERLPGATRSEDCFIRKGITISGVRSRLASGLRALVLIDDDPLVEFLGDAENPAHTEWQSTSRIFRDKYVHGRLTLSFVRHSVQELSKLLSTSATGVDKALLDDVFFLEESGNKPDKERTVDPSPIEQSDKGPFTLSQVSGGFRIGLHPQRTATPTRGRLLVAYRVRRGNPFTKYNSMDFDLAKPPIQVVLEGANSLKCEGNSLRFEVTDGGVFRVEVRGFDQERDIVASVYEEES